MMNVRVGRVVVFFYAPLQKVAVLNVPILDPRTGLGPEAIYLSKNPKLQTPKPL